MDLEALAQGAGEAQVFGVVHRHAVGALDQWFEDQSGGGVVVLFQMVFERLLGQQAALSVVIEFAGGLFFLYLLLKGRIR